MSGPPPPSFSTFPDLSQPKPQPLASSSRFDPSVAVPTFSSFPDLPELASQTKVRSSKRSLSPDDAGRKKRSGDRDEEDRTSLRKSRRDGDQERADPRSRQSSKEREKDKRRDKEERRAKEKRREKERQQAKDLISGVSVSALVRKDEEDLLELDRKRKKGEEEAAKSLVAEEDGTRWYDDAPKSKASRPTRDSQSVLAAPSMIGFFSDTRPDLKNVEFGRLAITSIPKYHRAGYGHVVGLPEAYKIVRDTEERGKALEVAFGDYEARERGSLLSNIGSGDHLQRILLRPSEQNRVDHLADFLPLASQREINGRTSSLYANYKDGSDVPIDVDVDSELVEARRDGLDIYEQRVGRDNQGYEHRLKEDPTSVETWIAYSTSHLKLLPGGLTAAAAVTMTDKNGGVTLSILSKALDAHRDNRYSPELHLAYMWTMELIKSAEMVMKRWKWILSEIGQRAEVEGSQKMKLWLKYLDWREGQGFDTQGEGGEVGGGVDEMVDVYVECLNMIRHGVIGGQQVEVEENLLYLLRRACLFLKHAGFNERATAIYQAMLELTFFKPKMLDHKGVAWPDLELWRDDLVVSLEQFWDAEVARVGETGAPTWRAAEAGASPAFRHPQPRTQVMAASPDPFEQWYAAERHQERSASRPAPATDLDVDDEDPYRVILFADVEPFLFVLQTPSVARRLVFDFLSFLGLPFSPPGTSTKSPATKDPHLYWSIGSSDALRSRMWPVRLEDLESSTPETSKPSAFDCPVKSWLSESSDQFARTGQWFRLLEPGELDHADVEMARLVLKQLRPEISDPGFTSLSLVLESTLSPKNAIKLAKEALSRDRDNLFLWQSYANMVHQRGKVSEARLVYVKALQAAMLRHEQAFTEFRLDDAKALEAGMETLWAGWAEMELAEIEVERCQAVLVHAFGVGREDLEAESQPDFLHQTPASNSILRAFKRSETPRVTNGHSYIVLRVLLTYHFRNLKEALLLLARQIESLPAQPSAREALIQFRARLLHTYGLRPYAAALPGREVRAILTESIADFPCNTALLSLYLQGQLHGDVHGQTRSLIRDLTKDDDRGQTKGGVLAYLWGAWAEARSDRAFWRKNSAGQERVRSLLDRGITSAEGKRSASLWKLYIEFLALSDRGRDAHAMCFRAVRALGGNKELCMLPFTPALRPLFTSKELKAWAQFMLERGIRVRVPFERYWSNEEEEVMEIDDDGEEGPVDPALQFLVEREQAKPY